MRPAVGGCICGGARPAATSAAATTLWRVTRLRTGGRPGHPIIRSFEPGEDWFWNYQTNEYYDGPELAAPDCRPKDETVPGPRGRVPDDWADQLRRRGD